MAFSFSNWFKKPVGNESPADSPANPEPAASVATVPAPPSAPANPAAARPAPTTSPTVRTRVTAGPAKSVLPNSVRPIGLHEGARPAAHVGSAPAVPSSVSLRNASTAAPTARSVPFPALIPAPSSAPVTPTPDTSPAPSVTNMPDTSITLLLGDFVDSIPANLLKAGALVDRQRPVVFRAADLYSDLARGRAAVPVSTIQAVCPDLFSRPVSNTEDVEVALPLQKLVEQLGTALHNRADQVAEDDVTEIETPFLQVALEDSVRLPKPPPSALPKLPAPPVPTATPARRPTGPILMPTPGSPLAAANAGLGEITATVRGALTPRSVHVPPPRKPTGAEPAHVSPINLTGTPGANAGLTAPTQATVAPINASAKRPPSTVRASVAGGKIRLSGPAISSRSIAPPAAPGLVPATPGVVKPIPVPPAVTPASVPAQKKTARVQIPAIALRSGAGNNAANGGVPAAPPPRLVGAVAPTGKPTVSSEPPFPFHSSPGQNPTPAAPASALPPLPPPKFAPLPARVERSPILQNSATSFATPPPAPPAPETSTVAPASALDVPTISLALGPILRSLPEIMFPAGLDGNVAATRVPDDARVEFPLPFITEQLAQGRVAVPHPQFVAAMPEAFRYLLPAEGEPSEVLIPLPEVFQSLPTGALDRRQDQFVEEVGPEIPTPFSLKAQEDAARLQATSAPMIPPAEPAAPDPEPTPEPALSVALAEPLVNPVAAAEPEPELAGETVTPQESLISTVEDHPSTSVEKSVEADLESVTAEHSEPVVAAETTPVEASIEPPAPVEIPAEPLVESLDYQTEVTAESATQVLPEENPAAQAELLEPEPLAAAVTLESEETIEVPAPTLLHEPAADALTESPVVVEEPPVEESNPVVSETTIASTEVTPVEVLETPAETTVEPPAESEVSLEPAAPQANAEPSESEAATTAAVTEPTPQEITESPADTIAEEHSFVVPVESFVAAAEAEATPTAPVEEFVAQPEPEPAPIHRLSVPTLNVMVAEPAREETRPVMPVMNGTGEMTPAPVDPSPSQVEEAQEALRAIFMVDDDLDAKKIVKLISELPGLKACAVMFADGLKLAGKLDAVSSSEGFCAMTPPFFQRAAKYAEELNLGEMQCATIQTERALLSYFMRGDICLSVQHAGTRGFLPGVREKLLGATGELAKMYAAPAARR